MMRFGHSLSGVALTLGAAPVLGWSAGQAVAGATVAAIVAPWPDLDLRFPSHRGPWRHRGITHAWVGPLALALAGWVFLPGAAFWLAVAAALGWASHILADAVFGRRVWGSDGPGVPLVLWWDHRGLGLASDGLTSQLFAYLLLPALITWECWILL